MLSPVCMKKSITEDLDRLITVHDATFYLFEIFYGSLSAANRAHAFI